jgi:Divergent InlB B-repeat domain/Abnormal spindle-like microcephaly-assoc'd, ASPM-SPD-2-Hydin
VTAPSVATTYTATFSTSYQLTTGMSPSGGGTVTPATGSYYASGAVVNLSATPSSGYAFSSWTGSVANPSSASTTITMSGPETVTANFISAITIAPASVSFGTVYLGKKASESVTLTNNGTASITISSRTITAPDNALGDYSVTSGCTGSLGARKSCTISLSFDAVADIFSPTASTATLTITTAAGSPQTVPLTVTVIDPLATLSATSVAFSTQKEGTTSAAQTVTLTNTGNTPLTLGTLSISGNFAIVSADTTCANGGTVQPTASCVIGVDFTPTAKGTRTGTLKITDNALSSPQEVSLSGTGD